MGASGETITYAELDVRSNRLARALRAAGLGPEDGVVVMAGNHPRAAETYWAAYRSGLRFIPVNPRLQPSEIAYILDNSGAIAMIVDAALEERLAGIDIPDRIALRLTFGDSYEQALAAQPPAPVEDATEGGAMIYSSGTTGRPKGVKRPLSGRPPGSSFFGLTADMVQRSWAMSADSVTLIPMPIYHSSGVTRLMVALSLGMKVVLMERFDALTALRLIEEHRITHGIWVPTMLVRMLQLPEADRRRYDLSSQTHAIVGSGPCPVWVKDQIIEWWGPILSETYGGTEGNGMTVISSEEWLRHEGSVGRPVFGVIHILDDDGQEVSAGEPGGIFFEGGREFEYHGDPEQTRAAHSAQGWSTLGDVGYLDTEGYLHITDRRADLIISGGVNVYPLEVEKHLSRHRQVRDVAVIGVPDEDFGESVKAVVELLDPNAAGPELERDLIEFCRAGLAHYKCPRSVDFVDALPREPTGKLLKRQLRERYWAGRASRLV
jgi:acyl-CoA synthetase (AMP-forming)/AMP-acid ligase II